MVFIRSAISLYIQYCLYFSLRYINIGLWSIIFNCGPFCSLILSYLLLKEKLLLIEEVNMMVCFIGVVLVILSSKNDAKEPNTEVSLLKYILAITLCFSAAVCTSIVGVIVKTIKNVNIHLINTFYAYMLMVISLVVWIFYRLVAIGNFEYNLTNNDYLLMLAMMVSTGISN